MKPKHFPDMAAVLKLTDPAKRKAALEQALENAERPTPPGFFANYDTDGEDAAGDDTRASAPSPWANGADPTLDNAALPSAMGPDAGRETAGAAAAPGAPPARAAGVRSKLAAKHVVLAVVLGLCVAGVAVAMPVLTQRVPKPPPMEAMHATAPSAAATAPATAAAEPSATAVSAATSSAGADPKAPGTRSRKGHETIDDDPYGSTPPDRAPAPPVDAGKREPAAPPSPPKPQGSGDPLLNE